VRLSALGDIVFATSLLAGLRARFPQAHIAWLAQSGFAGVLEGDPRVDDLIRAPKEVLKSISALKALRKTLRQGHYDWVIDCQGLLKSRILAWLAGGTRIGFSSKEPGEFLMHHLLPKGGNPLDISSEYRYLAEQITGLPAAAPQLQPGAAAIQQLESSLPTHGLRPGFIALCPFTTRPQKHWMEDYWPRLATLLAAASSERQFVIFGGPADREAAARIHAGLPAGSINLAGQTRLSELGAWLSQAALVVGVDTGLTHIGIAMQRPTLALFGSTRPYTGGANSPLTVLYDALPCAPCRRNPTCGGAWTCMRQLTPERVAAAAENLLKQGLSQ
jgi:heptosyltransferase-1